jgi:hypothetical protein
LSDWASDQAYEVSVEQATKAARATAVDFSQAVAQLAQATGRFETVGNMLTGLPALQGSIDASAQAISDAISSFPTHIEQSTGKISADVARGISQELHHQVEYLKGVLAIYGEQQVVLQTVLTHMGQMASDHAKAATSLASLSELPAALHDLRHATQGVASTNDRVASVTSELDRKVALLPVAEMKEAIRRFTDAATQFAAARLALDAILTSANAAIDSLHAAGLKDTLASLDHTVNVAVTISSALTTQVDGLATTDNQVLVDLHASTEQIIRGLTQLKTDSAVRGFAQAIADLETAVQSLQRRIETMPWFALRRLVGA